METIKEFKIGDILIGDNHPVIFIAEVACEHQGSLEVAKSMIKAIKDIQEKTGRKLIIKFQLHIAENEFVPNTIKFWAGNMDEVLKAVNLEPPEKHIELMELCRQLGVQYLCTSFDTKTAKVLYNLESPAFKVGSGELTNHPTHKFLAKVCAEEGKPVIFSTGMSNLNEIDETVEIYRKAGAKNWAIANCDSVYPPSYNEVRLGMISVLKERYGAVVGHSDHTPTIYTALGAIAKGANFVEKHITTNRRLKGPDVDVCLELQEFEELVIAGMAVESALGADKNILPKEQVVRDWASHWVVTDVEIPQGTAITPEMVSEKRSGGLGKIPAKNLEELYGKKAGKDLPKHYFLSWDDVI